MGLRTELQADIAEAFDDDLGDAVTAFTGSRVTGLNYNPVTDTQDTTTISYSGRGVFADYSAREIDGETILRTDQQLVALQNEVDQPPKNGDRINGFDVINTEQDPAACVWVLQLRRV